MAADSQPFRTAAQAAPSGMPRRSLAATVVRGIDRWVVLVTLIYGAAAVGLVGVLHLPSAEAIARTAHLGTLFDGVDPLPLAFGIERPPLLTMLALPASAIEPLRDHALSAALGTALSGGLTVVAARRLARWAGFGRITGFAVIAAFALNPLLLVSGAIGLPEALYSTVLLFGLGQVARWIDQESTGAAIGAGAAFGVAYLLRYNVVVLALAVGLAFWYIGTVRGTGPDREERGQAWGLAFAVPTIFAIGLFALITWFAHGHLNEFLLQADRLSALAANDHEVARQMSDLERDAVATTLWVGRWSILVGAASWLGIGALVLYAGLRREAGSGVLAAVLIAVLAPEWIALVSGQGQPHATHLIPFMVTGFVAIAYLMRVQTGGAPPNLYDRRGRRIQLVAASILVVSSAASTAALPLFPEYDQPMDQVLRRVVERDAASWPADVQTTAAWIKEFVPHGGLLVDIERDADVMAAVNDYGRFRTEGDDNAEAILFDPIAAARFILVREPIEGAGDGRIERAHRDIFDSGAAFTTRVFEAGRFRIYQVDGPVLP